MKEYKRIELKPHYVAYIDILGAKEMIKSYRSEDFLQDINKLYQDTLLAIQEKYKYLDKINIKTKIFSDNIIIAIEKENNTSIAIESMKQDIIFSIAAFFQVLALNYSMLTRGSITIGNLFINDQFVYGEALVNAYELESSIAVYPRIIINHENSYDFIVSQYLRNFITRDKAGICYINSFANYFYVAQYYEQETIKLLAENILKKFNEVNNCKRAQKIFWLVNEFNKFCQDNNFTDFIIPLENFTANIIGYRY